MAKKTKEQLATTQDHLDIYDIKYDLVFLKNGSVSAVIQTTAVNFDLLSEIEQDAIIAAFSMILNSITFSVQVVVRSKKLDITKYLEKIYKIETKIKDPLMRYHAESYRKYVQDIIKENDVLDKNFYIVVSTGPQVFSEPGSGPFDWALKLLGKQSKRLDVVDTERLYKEAQTSLIPKIDHIVSEFQRLGVKIRKLDTQELVELYFDIYNPTSLHGQRIRTNVEDYKTAIVSPAILEE